MDLGRTSRGGVNDEVWIIEAAEKDRDVGNGLGDCRGRESDRRSDHSRVQDNVWVVELADCNDDGQWWERRRGLAGEQGLLCGQPL